MENGNGNGHELKPAAGEAQLASARDFQLPALARVAANVAASSLFPQFRGDFKKRQNDIFTLFLLAQARGLHPMEAMRRFHVIEGQPSMKADAMLAEFLSAGGRVHWVTRTNEVVEADFFSPSDPEAPPVRIKWTMEEAKKQGIAIGRDGQIKANWKRHPRQMLTARVISEGVRLLAPEVVLGIYTPEEAVDFSDVKQVDVATVSPEVPSGPMQGFEREDFNQEPKPVQPARPVDTAQPAKKPGRKPAAPGIHAKVREALLDYGVAEEAFPEFLRDLLGRQRRMNLEFLTHKQCQMILAKLRDMKQEETQDSEQPEDVPQVTNFETPPEEPVEAAQGDARATPTPTPTSTENAAPAQDSAAPADDLFGGPVEGDRGTGQASPEILNAMFSVMEGRESDPKRIRAILGAYLKARFASKSAMQDWSTRQLGRMVTSGNDLTLAEVHILIEAGLNEEKAAG